MRNASARGAVDAMLKVAEVVPLNAGVFYQAGAIQTAYDLSVQDSIVLASILSHITKTAPAESCFLSRNTKDFDDPNVRDMLDELGCKLFGRFDDGLNYIKARLRREGQ